MKEMISRVFSRTGGPAQPGSYSVLSSELCSIDIANYYLRVIVDCLRRMLVPPDSFEVRIKQSGTGPNGLSAFSGYVRILKWDAVVTPVLLQNLPVVDGQVRKVVKASVLLQGTYFAGLWFQASSATQGSPTTLFGVPCELIHRPAALLGKNGTLSERPVPCKSPTNTRF